MPPDASVLDPLQRAVDAHPDAVAVVDADGTSCTYAELSAAADRIAAALAVEPGEMVGVSGPRGAGLVAAMVGIVRAGGVYVPVAVDDPPDRVAALCTRLGLRFWVSDTVTRVGDGPAPVVRLGGAGAERPLYVMPTSGSTGVPKYVVVAHRGVLRLVHDTVLTAIGPTDRVAFASNPAFDATTWEVWATLGNGATIVTVPAAEVADAARLRRRLEHHGVTLAFVTTALFDHLAQADPHMFGGLRTLAVGGEQMRIPSVRAVLASPTPPARLVNVYGPTETTTFATCHPVTSLPPDATRVPIGRALSHTDLVVVDDHGMAVPEAETGELWIAGDGMALGYLDDPDATRLAFVERSFPGHENTRWYRTGDLVRRDADGAIDCLGRRDRQLKVNGHRVEPAEIEQAMAALPGVRAAVVVSRRRGTSLQLVGFVVGDDTLDATDVRRRLTATLPRFLVPSRLHVVPSLPVTANGKIDESALLALADTPREGAAGAATTLRDPVGEFVVDEVRRIVDDDRIGLDDDLLACGLDSLGAVTLMIAIGRAGFAEPSPTLLIEHRSPRQIADWLRDHRHTTDSSVVHLGADAEQRLVFVPGGGLTALSAADLARHAGDRVQVVAVEAEGLHTAGRPDLSVRAMARRVVAAAQREQPTGVVLLSGHSSGGVIAHEAARQLQRAGRQVRLLSIDAGFEGNRRPRGFGWTGLVFGVTVRVVRRVSSRIARVFGRPTRAVSGLAPLHPRYQRSYEIAWLAVHGHRARPIGVAVRCLHAEGAVGQCAGRVEGDIRQCVQVSGDHRSVLHEPHVGTWAAASIDWLLGAGDATAAAGDAHARPDAVSADGSRSAVG